jgi:aminoglycoside phosphotransferase (APT) family kinase protein
VKPTTPREVIRAANLGEHYSLEPCPWTEKGWRYGPYVLRLGVSDHEVQLLRYLPRSVPHAPLVTAGDGWIVERSVAGEPLRVVWTTLPQQTQRAAVQQFAAILINLHSLRIAGTRSLSPGWFTAVLPVDIVRLATDLRDDDPRLFDSIIGFTRRTMDEINPPLRWGFIHRNLNFDCVLWSGDRITALLHFGQAAHAPRELELDALLRFCRSPSPGLHPDDLEAVPGWLEEDYPYLFSEPGWERRLRLYAVEHYLRQYAATRDRALLDCLHAEIGW